MATATISRLPFSTNGRHAPHREASTGTRPAAFDRGVAVLSAALLGLADDATDARIVEVLGRVTEWLGLDSAAIGLRPAEGSLVPVCHQWIRDGVLRPRPFVAEATVPWIAARLAGGEPVIFWDPDDVSPDVADEAGRTEERRVPSNVTFPLTVAGTVTGWLTFGSLRAESAWPSAVVEILHLVARVVAGALARRNAECALRRALAENESLRERLRTGSANRQEEMHDGQDVGEIVGRSTPLRATLAKVDQVAATDAPVLLFGETGTGKELLARAIHARSHRRRAPLIAVNCAALPTTLIESELFGHERGAFTGATGARPGRFELAEGGTLFLDEIGDLEPMLQTKLLRVLQDGEFQRLGSTVTRKANVRIVSATNRDLTQALGDGRFRPDLYYRLAVFPIEVAPLRERRQDIPLLVWHFIQARQRRLGRMVTEVPASAMDTLVAYEWPGNVRELHNVIERALILSPGPVLRIEEAMGAVGVVTPERGGRADGDAPESLRETERALLVRVLERCHWVIEGRGRAADRLGLRPSTLRNRLRRLGIGRPLTGRGAKGGSALRGRSDSDPE